MADAPRDPRQLARDILSGKISIEDLAREQRRRQEAAGGGGAMKPAQANVPAKVPLPRPVQAKPVQRQSPPVQRPVPRPATSAGGGGMQRPVGRGPVQPQRQVGKPTAGPNVTVSRGQEAVKGPVLSAPAVSAMPAPLAAKTLTGAYGGTGARATGVLGLRGAVKDRAALRRAVVMAEILGKPLSLREE